MPSASCSIRRQSEARKAEELRVPEIYCHQYNADDSASVENYAKNHLRFTKATISAECCIIKTVINK